ncbi:HlyD family type I secretion periplasmic adaptor subunit [Sphingosinicella humi]|uniref:HlyD family type I secretion periplasmic adaptor subunit n=1 Tax=Allosphingosinicella humi TaxID=2068657 RepID=UPI001FB07100|nr:HlyD family type I secretion periplasmic adaptor subunit [Sphingosinicella humi]
MRQDLVLSGKRAVANVGGFPVVGPDYGATGDPSREIRFGLIIAAIFFIGFLGWAAIAPMDAAAYADGKLVVSGQRQTVQHRDGGIVGALYVTEGQQVRRGQVLMQLAASELLAQERSLTSQFIGLLAQKARLQAEQAGRNVIPMPAGLAGLSGEDASIAQEALRLQQMQLQTRSSLLEAQRAAFGQRTAQIAHEADGYRSQLESAAEQERLLTEELRGLKELAAKGFVSRNRIRALERARAELRGQRGQYRASIAGSGEAVGEARVRILELEREHQERVAAELREVETTLRDVQPRLTSARDQLRRTAIKAPVGGAVVGLSVFTVGGVVAPGQKLLDVVPRNAPMLVEARVAPKDADDLAPGQTGLVRFPGLHERNLPNLEGRITRISADALVDERTGESYFTVDVEVPLEELKGLRGEGDGKLALRAGMPAQVLIPLRKRTALQYAFEPLFAGMWRSLREQ